MSTFTIQSPPMSVDHSDTGPSVPLVRQIPPEPAGSPTVMPHDDGGPWWTPTWADIAKHVGWRWVLALPAVAIAVLLVPAWFVDLRALFPLWFLGMKVVVIAIAIPIL